MWEMALRITLTGCSSSHGSRAWPCSPDLYLAGRTITAEGLELRPGWAWRSHSKTTWQRRKMTRVKNPGLRGGCTEGWTLDRGSDRFWSLS